MSFDLAVWYSNKPLTDSEASEIYAAAGEADSRNIIFERHASVREFFGELIVHFPDSRDLPEGEWDKCPWSCPLSVSDGCCEMCMSWSRVNDVVPLVLELAAKHGLVCFDPQSSRVFLPPAHNAVLGRENPNPKLLFSVEEEEPVRAPTVQQIRNAIARMRVNGGPSFAILESTSGSYTQIAGGDGLYTAEWREQLAEGFKHWIAGKDGDNHSEIAIPTNGCQVTVKSNEQLNASDVDEIFAAFSETESRPTRFKWRDITDRF
ncbi:MAG: hypothetical protein HZA46_14405 [Planctomycetales bacterium]|nr:hypothetical protein [Planctomycetales bacterium]